MLWARESLERSLPGRGVGAVVAVVLVVLVLLVGVHPVADHFVEEAGLICTVIALAGLVVVPVAGEPVARRPRPEASMRLRTLVTVEPRLSTADGQQAFPLLR